MQNTCVTIGLPVGNLPEAIGWYRTVLGSRRTHTPVPHILEFEVASGIWLQLVKDPAKSPGDGVVRFEVKDLTAERDRLLRAGIDVSEITLHKGVIAFLYLTDPYGNRFCLYQERP